ncbi:MAG TPA: TIGR03118 family protein [Pyrinomonadaceae bacterium]|nr:TIGR03118 family protein [Pyrinomonadaceae bacterium]
MFRSQSTRYGQLRTVISVVLSVCLYSLMLPVVSSKGHLAPTATKPLAERSATPQDPAPNIPVIPPGSAYRQTNFVSDIPGFAPVLDPLLVNPWGVTATASSPFWVSNNGTSTTQLIRGDQPAGTPVVLNASPQTITIPGGLPTGTVASPTATDFVLPGACASAPCGANFLFASITGNITGWDPNAPAAGSTTAVIAASHPGHVYTGLALANNGTNHLYAADFANGAIDVYDASFALQPPASFPFADPTIPNTMGNTYHPFNIQNIGGSLYVTYAKVDPMTGLDEDGIGNGFVRRFNTNGVRDLTFGIDNGALNSPWGIALAPASFGIFGGALLIGNFGEGNPSIHAYNPTTGAFLGTLQDESGNGIVIDELWGLQVGNGGAGGNVNTIYFSAGTAEEEHGLFGALNPTTASATSLIQFATDDFTIGEGSGHIDITVTRAGDASGTASVSFNTFDESQSGHASQKSDYEIALGTISFAPGETSKTVRILVVNDNFVEGDETIDLALSNVTGSGAGLGSPSQAEVTITDNDVVAPTTNPIDDATFFVRQHYLDFLNREPDPAGLAFWVNQITSCGDAACVDMKRINVSAAFFLSAEFQNTGFLAYLTHRAAFGSNASGSPAPVLYGNFERDVQALQKNYTFGAVGADAQLEANKQAYFNEFVTRPQFVTQYPATLTNAQYVDALLASAGIDPANQRLFVVNLTNAQEVPPTNPTTSGGAPRPASFGTAKFRFNAAQTSMSFTATINNIDIGGQTTDSNDNLIAAHIHAGASVAPGVNGPVVWGFFGSPFNDNNPNDQAFGPLAGGGVGGNFSGKWDAPEGNGTTLAAQLTNLRTGHAYINFHTVQFGGGEIRGNFPTETAFRDALVAGLNGATETRATVLRKVAENEELASNEFNRAFVTMQYFGYLRRDPDTSGFNFWLNKLNAFNGNFVNAEMVKAFLLSSEYRQRFGP